MGILIRKKLKLLHAKYELFAFVLALIGTVLSVVMALLMVCFVPSAEKLTLYYGFLGGAVVGFLFLSWMVWVYYNYLKKSIESLF